MLEALIQHDGLEYETKHPGSTEEYTFHDTDITVSMLYEFKDLGRVISGLKKIGRKHHSKHFAGYDLTSNRLDEIYDKFKTPIDQRTAQVGQINLDEGQLEGYFSEISLSIESVGSDFFLLNAFFHLKEDSAKVLDEGRKILKTQNTIGLNLYVIHKKIWLTHSTRGVNSIRFYRDLASVTRTINSFLDGFLSQPVETVFGTITLYETDKKAVAVTKDFTKTDIAYFALSNGFEKLYIETYEGFNYLRVFNKVKKSTVGILHAKYHNTFFDDYGPIIYGIAFYEYIDRIRDEVYGLLVHSSKQNRVKSLAGKFSIARIKDLQTRNSSLGLKRYYLTTIRNFLDSYIWERYISGNKYSNGVAARNYMRYDKNIEYVKESEDWLRKNIDIANKLINTGITQFKNELEIQNTSSNNRLSRVLLILSALALLLTAGAAFIQLYPNSTRIWLCDIKIYCNNEPQ